MSVMLHEPRSYHVVVQDDDKPNEINISVPCAISHIEN